MSIREFKVKSTCPLTAFYERAKHQIKLYIDANDYEEFYNNEDYDGESNYFEGMRDWCSHNAEFKTKKECYDFIHNDAETLFELTKYYSKKMAEDNEKTGCEDPVEIPDDITNLFDIAMAYIVDELAEIEENK
jgi:hypothetical protein